MVHGLEKHYNRHFDPKLTQGICEVLRIPCSCIYCTSLLEKSWSPGVLHAEKTQISACFRLNILNCVTLFQKWSIIKFINKIISNEEFDDIHNTFLG